MRDAHLPPFHLDGDRFVIVAHSGEANPSRPRSEPPPNRHLPAARRCSRLPPRRSHRRKSGRQALEIGIKVKDVKSEADYFVALGAVLRIHETLDTPDGTFEYALLDFGGLVFEVLQIRKSLV